jgi:hypothetical protein
MTILTGAMKTNDLAEASKFVLRNPLHKFLGDSAGQ